MWRFLFLFCAAAGVLAVGAGIAPADVINYTTYVEDFEENGEPGFGYPFVHEIGRSPYSSGSYSWQFYGDIPGHGTVLYLGVAQDAVSFSLPSGYDVCYASVEYRMGGGAGAPYYSIDFIGRDGSERVSLPRSSNWQKAEMSFEEVGPIHEIQMRCSEGFFDNVTIRVVAVVPEPSAIAVLAIALSTCLFLRIRLA